VKWENGAIARNLKRVRYDLGPKSAFYAVFPLADAGGGELKGEIKGAPVAETSAATVSDDVAHNWYDMRNGAFLGKGASAKIKIEPNRPTLVSALPYAVDKVALHIRRLDQGHIFKIGIDLQVANGATPGQHIFHVGVLDPSGKLMPHHAANVIADYGTAQHQIA